MLVAEALEPRLRGDATMAMVTMCDSGEEVFVLVRGALVRVQRTVAKSAMGAIGL